MIADGERLADVVPGVNEPDADRQNDRADDPSGYLNKRGLASIDRGMQVIEDSKQEERNPAEQLEVGMRRHAARGVPGGNPSAHCRGDG